MTPSSVLDSAALGRADTPALLDHRIDELLLQVRGLALVRDLLRSRARARMRSPHTTTRSSASATTSPT